MCFISAVRFCFWSQIVAILLKGWSHARRPHPLVEIVWWFDLSVTPFSSGFRHVRWATKSQSAQSKVAMSSKYKMATSIYSGVWQFLCERDNSVHQCSVVGDIANLLTNKLRHGLQVCLREGCCRIFSSRLMTEIRKFTAPFTSDRCFDG